MEIWSVFIAGMSSDHIRSEHQIEDGTAFSTRTLATPFDS